MRSIYLGLMVLIHLPLCAATNELVIPKLEQTPSLNDFQGMAPATALAKQMVNVSGFIQRAPQDNEKATQKTRVFLGHDAKNLYVVFLAFDDEPDKIRARMAPRETVDADDTVNIMVDTFNDQRRGYTFRCNPLGIQWDAAWSEGSSFDSSFNAVWRSDGKITDAGYMVSMVIPFKSLRFPSGDRQVWGLMFNRGLPRNAEFSYWPRYSNRIQGRLNQAGSLVIEANLSQGRNTQFTPYVTARSFELLDPEQAAFIKESFEADGGLDAKMVIGDSMVLDATANPDFSQVESDSPQITVNQRFEVFFPERRPFFLENADIFQMPTNMVFTRRIADPRGGVRLTGKAGKYGIGAFLVDDEAPGKQLDPDDPNAGDVASIGVLRLSRDLFSQSKLGFIYTGREFAGNWNHVFGVDARVLLGKNWNAQAQVVGSRTDIDAGEREGGHLATMFFNREGRKLSAHLHASQADNDFQTQLGFLRSVQRAGTRNFHGSGTYKLRPEGPRLISYGPSIRFETGWDYDTGKRLEASLEPSFQVELVGNTLFEAKAELHKERVGPEEFEALTGPVNFSYQSMAFNFDSSYYGSATWGLNLEIGETPNFRPAAGVAPELADVFTGTAGMDLRPMPALRIQTNFLYIRLTEPDGGDLIFSNQIVRSRVNWQFSKEFSMRLILNYEELDANALRTDLTYNHNLNGDLLLTWLVNPWTALYVGYNSNYNNTILREGEGGPELVMSRSELEKDAHQYFLKFSYLL